MDDAKLAYEVAVAHGGKGVLAPLLLEEKANGESMTISEVRLGRVILCVNLCSNF